MRILSILIIFISAISNLFAQSDCYTNLRQQGIDVYNAADYETAIIKWTAAKSCSNLPVNQDLDTWISKANDAKKCQAKRIEGETAYSLKDYDKAISLWQEIINVNCVSINIDNLKKQIEEANNAKKCDKLQIVAQEFFNNKQYEEAIKVCRDALACTNLSEVTKTEIKNLIQKSDSEIKAAAQKKEKSRKFNATRLEAQRANALKNYDLAISKWRECLQYTSNEAEQKEIYDSIKRVEETRTFTFIVRPIQIFCKNIDDGIEGRSIPNPRGHIDRDAEIFGQVSMRVNGANCTYSPYANPSDIVPFWQIPLVNRQSMTQGKTYQLNQTLNRTVTIKGLSALKVAQFVLIGNGRASNNLNNSIIDYDGSNDAPEIMEASPSTAIVNFLDIKTTKKGRYNHQFTTGTGKNVVIFTYEIEFLK